MSRRSCLIIRLLVSLRTWLTANKIFFEVVVAGLLSWMALTVAKQANNIAKAQTKIMEQEHLPRLEIRKNQQKNPNSGIYDHDIWYVFNRGGNLRNFEMRNFTFANFVKSKGIQQDTISLPVYGYFSMRGTLSGEGNGLVYDFDNEHHGALEQYLRISLLNHGMFEVDSYGKVSYMDIFDKSHVEYYKLYPSIEKVSESEYIRLDSLHKFAKHYTFSDLTPKFLLNFKSDNIKN